MFVLGVDPGVSRCGYCVLRVAGQGASANHPVAVALGVITTPPDQPLPARLAELQADFRSLIAEHRPRVVAIERVLFQVNVQTAMSVGQASGVVMAEAASAGAHVVEYSPNQVKEAVTGFGAADKQQVQEMVQMLLGLATPPRPADAADAAAVALCHVAHAGSAALVPGSTAPVSTARSGR